MAESKLSILGLYNWDNTIFDLMQFPVYQDGENVHEFSTDEKNMLIQNILAECQALEIIYPNPVVMKNMIGLWSAMEKPTWNRIFRAALAEYNPIENYHRTEHGTETLAHYDQHSGADTNQASGSDNNQASGSDTTEGGATDTNSGTDTTTGKITGYDSIQLVDHDQTDLEHGHIVENEFDNTTTYGRKDTVTFGRKDTFTHGEKIDHGGTIKNDLEAFGNIGVTTNMQMLMEEVDGAAKLNVFAFILESFKNRFCLLVF